MAKFTIPGDPIGYYAQGSRPNWTRMKKYHAYKAMVQDCAMAALILLPLLASKDTPMIIETKAYFRTGTHSDPENVHKGVVDALFWSPTAGKRGNDKHTGGRYHQPIYDKQNPRVEVEITLTC